MKTILALLAATIFFGRRNWTLPQLTAVIALAAIGCCGLLYDISILLSRIHHDMPDPVRDENRKAQRALAYQWRFAYTQRRLVTWFHVGIDAVAFDLTGKEVDRKVPAPITRIITAYHSGRTTTQLGYAGCKDGCLHGFPSLAEQ